MRELTAPDFPNETSHVYKVVILELKQVMCVCGMFFYLTYLSNGYRGCNTCIHVQAHAQLFKFYTNANIRFCEKQQKVHTFLHQR